MLQHIQEMVVPGPELAFEEIGDHEIGQGDVEPGEQGTEDLGLVVEAVIDREYGRALRQGFSGVHGFEQLLQRDGPVALVSEVAQTIAKGLDLARVRSPGIVGAAMQHEDGQKGTGQSATNPTRQGGHAPAYQLLFHAALPKTACARKIQGR